LDDASVVAQKNSVWGYEFENTYCSFSEQNGMNLALIYPKFEKAFKAPRLKAVLSTRINPRVELKPPQLSLEAMSI
jgi:hypothetical protein